MEKESPGTKRRKFQSFNESSQDGPTTQYSSRKLACTRCGHQQEAYRMQLRCREGFRAVHCPNCGKQERCLRNRCQSGTIWHQCHEHKVEPDRHISRKRLRTKRMNRKCRIASQRQQVKEAGAKPHTANQATLKNTKQHSTAKTPTRSERSRSFSESEPEIEKN